MGASEKPFYLDRTPLREACEAVVTSVKILLRSRSVPDLLICGETMVERSSHGPSIISAGTLQEMVRIKPDVVAPGSNIISTTSRYPGALPGISGQDWASLTSTSMATGIVAGSCAALRQSLTTRTRIADPSSALVKAALINGCDPLSTSGAPNYASGFGRINLANSEVDADSVLQDTVRDGWVRQQTFHVKISGELRVTLASTDPPGEVPQSDLDLTVWIKTPSRPSSADEEYHGNVGKIDPDEEAELFDRVNTVEKVTCRVTSGQTVILQVHGKKVISEQPFALVWRVLSP